MIPSDHINEQDLSKFREEQLSSGKSINIAAHLEACPSCRERFAMVDAPKWSGLPLDPEACLREDHLEFDQISEYLDGNLDAEDREVIEAHVKICRACDEDLNSLRVFRIETEPAMKKRYYESRLLSKLANIGVAQGIPRPAVAIGALGAMLIIVAAVWYLISRMSPEPAIVINPPEKTVTPEPVKDSIKKTDVEQGYSVALMDGGRRVGLDADGRLIGFGRIPEGLESEVERALGGRALRLNPELENLREPEGAVRSAPGGAEPLRLIGPMATLVRQQRPLFRWTKQEGATRYIVTIVDDRFNPVAESAPLAALEWRPEVELERGRVYQWQVTAFNGDDPVESRLRQIGLFKVIGAGELGSITKGEAGVDSALVRAVLYAKAGLLEDAERELRKLDRSGNDGRLRDKLRRAILRGGSKR
ncbi:MAG: zf-HC2 domain-containing protein [Acidobacteria bacterium]|nr:zf-HC2 domain-containing protein [Acidobacteriota bacterium]